MQESIGAVGRRCYRYFLFFFFFSSRRRHTRLQGDWSSDVCSSDLYFERVPEQSLIAGQNGTRHDYVIATRGASYLFAYTYTGKPFQIRMGAITGAQVEASWYSPRDGSAHGIGKFANQGVRTFTPPGQSGDGNDWVLVLDDVSKKFPPPGTPASRQAP